MAFITVVLAPRVTGYLTIDPAHASRWTEELRRSGLVADAEGVYRRTVVLDTLAPQPDDEVRALLSNPEFREDPHHPRWVRPDIEEAIRGWASGDRPFLSSFLRYVMENNLSAAVGQADHYNTFTFGAIVARVYNTVPMAARRDNVEAWAARNIERLRLIEEQTND